MRVAVAGSGWVAQAFSYACRAALAHAGFEGACMAAEIEQDTGDDGAPDHSRWAQALRNVALQNALDGVCVVTPYAHAAFDAADIQAASAKLSQGASVLVPREGSVIAINGWGQAFVQCAQDQGFRLSGTRVVVCGTGPQALSIAQACAMAGASRIALLGPSPDAAQSRLEAFVSRYRQLAYATVDLQFDDPGYRSFREAYEQPDYLFGSTETSTTEIKNADVVVACGTAGSVRVRLSSPFDAALVANQQLVCDLRTLGPSALADAADQAACTVVQASSAWAGCVAEGVQAVLSAAGAADAAEATDAVDATSTTGATGTTGATDAADAADWRGLMVAARDAFAPWSKRC